MVDTSIQQLNKYCLFEILKHTINSEIPEWDLVNKYRDLIHLALSCDWFRNLVRDWNSDLYKKLNIEEIYFGTTEDCYLNLNTPSKLITQKSKDIYWNECVNALKSYTQLKEVILEYKSETYDRDLRDVMDKIMDELPNIPTLTILRINIDGYYLERLPKLSKLEIFLTSSKFNVSDLIDFCKSNKSLQTLYLKNNENYGHISDIVPHCQELNDLRILIKRDFYDSEYTQLAKLPKLKYLEIQGKHVTGSLGALIQLLAAQESHTLEHLTIETHIEVADFVEACKVPTLQKLLCRISNIKNLKIMMSRFLSRHLTLTFDRDNNATNLADLSQVDGIQWLNIYGKHKTGTLTSFFKAIAEKETHELQYLLTFEKTNNEEDDDEDTLSYCCDDVEGSEGQQNTKEIAVNEPNKSTFNNDELLQILKIKSLQMLVCSYSDRQSLRLPYLRVPELHTVKIESQQRGFLINLFKAFAQRTPYLKLKNLNIQGYPISTLESRYICDIKTLTEFRGESNILFYNFVCYQRKTINFNGHDLLYDSPETIFKFFETSKETSIKTDKHVRTLTVICPEQEFTVLQELVMEENHIGPKIAKLLTLKIIICNFFDPQCIQCFKHLPKLESLKITSTHYFPDICQGILHVLNGYSNNITVKLHDQQITFNKSLGKLTIVSKLTDFNGQEYVPLAQLEHLRSLHIKGNPMHGSFQYLFSQFIQNPTIEEIICDGNVVFDYDEIIALSNIASLKRLKCGLNDGKCFDVLQNLRNVHDLTITSYPEDSLAQFLEGLALREFSNLQALSLSGNSLSFEAIAQIAKLNSLNRLKCEFADTQNIDQLAKLSKLEELTINAFKCNSLVGLFNAMTYPELENIKRLEITHRPILYEEMAIIVQFKNLRKLFCEFSDTKSIQLLKKLPELRELSLCLLNSETEGIEILAQLNKLTQLEIKSPKSGSLSELFKQLSAREIPILETLIVNGNLIDSTEMEAIAQLKTLRRLQCGLNIDNHECLADLTNLEAIEITPWIRPDYFPVNNTLLGILKNCRNINTIVVDELYEFDLDFLKEALEILKTVRNPQVQEAVRLCFSNFKGLTLEQTFVSNENYLVIDEQIEDTLKQILYTKRKLETCTVP